MRQRIQPITTTLRRRDPDIRRLGKLAATVAAAAILAIVALVR